MKKIIPVLLSCCFLCSFLCSCDDKSSSGDSAESESKVASTDSSSLSGDDQSAVTDQSGAEVTANTDIDPKRLNKDYDSLEKEASELLDKYYTSIQKDDYKTFSKVFPDFYMDALEEEGKDYNQTNEEFIKSINSDNKTKYGDDYYSFAKITAILQLTDDSLSTLKQTISETFGKKVDLQDAYSVYFTQTTRGKINSDSADMEYIMVKIDKKYYLYDEYFTYKDDNK